MLNPSLLVSYSLFSSSCFPLTNILYSLWFFTGYWSSTGLCLQRASENIFFSGMGTCTNCPSIRRFAWLMGWIECNLPHWSGLHRIDLLNGSNGPDRSMGLDWTILGLTGILNSRDWFSKERSGFDDVFSCPYFIIGLLLWADQIGCLQFAPSFFKNRIAYGKKIYEKSWCMTKR